MSNEAHFSIGGSFNKQNCIFLAEHNPQVVQPTTPLHFIRITVWCTVTAQEIIGPYFLEDHPGNAATVNTERYPQMPNEYLFPKLAEKGLDTFHFQQDGATCHTARISMAALRNKFLGKLISRFWDIDWTPLSPQISILLTSTCGATLRVKYAPTT